MGRGILSRVRRTHLRLGLGCSGDWCRNRAYTVVSLFFCGELHTERERGGGRDEEKAEKVKRSALGSRKGSRLARRQGLWGGGHSRSWTLAVFSTGLAEIAIVKRVMTISTEALKDQRNPPLTML